MMALHVRCHRCRYHFLKLHHLRVLQYVTQVHKRVTSHGKCDGGDELLLIQKSSSLRPCMFDGELRWRWDSSISREDKKSKDVNTKLSVTSKYQVLPIFSIENVERLLNNPDNDTKQSENKSLTGIITPFSNTCDDIIVWNSEENSLQPSENDILQPETDLEQPRCKLPVNDVCCDSNNQVQDSATTTGRDVENNGINFHVNLCLGQSGDVESTPPSDRPSKDQLLLVHNFLSHTIPEFFNEKLDVGIFHPDVILENNYWGKNKITHGVNAYSMEMMKIKMLSRLKFATLYMEILNMTVHTEDGSVKVRWRLKGLSQLRSFQFWKLLPWSYKKFIDSDTQWYDGFSVFYVGKDGLVYKHVLDRMMPDEPLGDEKSTGAAAKLGLVFALSPKPSLTDFQSLLSLLRSDLTPS